MFLFGLSGILCRKMNGDLVLSSLSEMILTLVTRTSPLGVILGGAHPGNSEKLSRIHRSRKGDYVLGSVWVHNMVRAHELGCNDSMACGCDRASLLSEMRHSTEDWPGTLFWPRKAFSCVNVVSCILGRAIAVSSRLRHATASYLYQSLNSSKNCWYKLPDPISSSTYKLW